MFQILPVRRKAESNVEDAMVFPLMIILALIGLIAFYVGYIKFGSIASGWIKGLQTAGECLLSGSGWACVKLVICQTFGYFC